LLNISTPVLELDNTSCPDKNDNAIPFVLILITKRSKKVDNDVGFFLKLTPAI
jgi:hypothetical protein